jgi:hypothetical protein
VRYRCTCGSWIWVGLFWLTGVNARFPTDARHLRGLHLQRLHSGTEVHAAHRPDSEKASAAKAGGNTHIELLAGRRYVLLAWSPARLLFLAYGRESTRINGNHERPTGNVIAWWTGRYGIYQRATRTVEC